MMRISFFIMVFFFCFRILDAGKPNVIVILVDDMGYSDLGSFGGEVRTPHLDRLAKNGLRFTQSYNSARCCPSRAKTPLESTGEAFEYHVEGSTDLQTWNKFGLVEESIVDLGENMERVTVATTSPIIAGERKFLRLRISVP